MYRIAKEIIWDEESQGHDESTKSPVTQNCLKEIYIWKVYGASRSIKVSLESTTTQILILAKGNFEFLHQNIKSQWWILAK